MVGFSSPLAKAYQTSVQGPFSSGPFAYNFAVKPTLPDGFVLCGEGGVSAENALVFLPFSDAPQGTLMSVRLFYWNRLGNDLDRAIWVGVPLVEVQCSVSNVAGPLGSGLLDANQRFCDQITLASGTVGVDGGIYSSGAGSDLVAMVNCEMQGARLLSFDFQATDALGQPIDSCTMNALWAKNS